MDSSERLLNGSVILAPRGKVDLENADQLKEVLLKAIETAARAKGAVICDLSQLDYISSAGLRALMIGAKTAKAREVAIGLGAMTPVVKEIFQISRFNLVFRCFDSVRAAIEAVAPAALPAFDAS